MWNTRRTCFSICVINSHIQLSTHFILIDVLNGWAKFRHMDSTQCVMCMNMNFVLYIKNVCASFFLLLLMNGWEKSEVWNFDDLLWFALRHISFVHVLNGTLLNCRYGFSVNLINWLKISTIEKVNHFSLILIFFTISVSQNKLTNEINEIGVQSISWSRNEFHWNKW